MARRSRTYSLRTYLTLLRRDMRRSLGRLVRTKRSRGQLVLTFTKPSFRTSRSYLNRLRAKRQQGTPSRSNVAVSLLVLALGLGGITYALIQLSGMQPDVPTVAAVAPTRKAAEPKQPAHLAASLPTHLTIPDIAVDTDVIQLGKNDDGSMQTPSTYDVVGWYQYSPTPGEIGPSVITGHVDNYKGAAVLFRLKEMQPGQKIMVTRADGSTAVFAVTKIEQFDQDHFPTDAVYGNTDDSELRVITCGGPFNHMTGEYTQNTVVSATYVPSG